MRSKTEMNEQTNSNTDAEEPRGVVYVVDDDEGVRDSLQYLLEASQYLVYTFASAENFLAQFDPHAIAVLVLDVRMPGMSGLQLQEELLARKAALPIVFVTGHGDVSMAVSTMKKGAVDFIEKPFNQADLKALVDRLLVQARERAAAVERERMNAALLARLTAREQQVLERIVAGRLNKQIAADLGISIKTVEAHRANIMDKLEANTVADLMRVALRSVAPAEG
jgi:two-component system response regulator TtrR